MFNIAKPFSLKTKTIITGNLFQTSINQTISTLSCNECYRVNGWADSSSASVYLTRVIVEKLIKLVKSHFGGEVGEMGKLIKH